MHIFYNAEASGVIVERSADDGGEDSLVKVIKLIFQSDHLTIFFFRTVLCTTLYFYLFTLNTFFMNGLACQGLFCDDDTFPLTRCFK